LLVSTAWKISIHTSCIAGSVVSLALLVHPLAVLLAPLLVAAGWARVVQRDHTVMQVLAGSVAGATIAAGGLVLLGAASTLPFVG
jgi:hypothetical protein